jgi:hypothetical protein
LTPKKLFKYLIEIFEFFNISSKSIKDESLNASSKYIKETTKSNDRYYIKLLNKKELKKSINNLFIILYCNSLNKKSDLFIINITLFDIDIKCADINDDKIILIEDN